MAPAVTFNATSSPNWAQNFDTDYVTMTKNKRNLPGNPDPDAEVIALSPTTLMATNKFICEVCKKGFPRDQNLQLHRRGHNLPWKLKQNETDAIRIKKVYVCPESSCVHHHPSRALGDLTGIKKHYGRKHGEKKWKCIKCSKAYAVQSDLKAHSALCGTREYRCECGTAFSRRNTFITHKTFCDAKESGRLIAPTHSILHPNTITNNTYKAINRISTFTSYARNINISLSPPHSSSAFHPFSSHPFHFLAKNHNPNPHLKNEVRIKEEALHIPLSYSHHLYQEGRSVTKVQPSCGASTLLPFSAMDVNMYAAWQKSHDLAEDGFTRNFLGLVTGEQCGGGDEEKVRPEFPPYSHGHDDHFGGT